MKRDVTIGQIIKTKLTELNISAYMLSKKSQISQSYISGMLNENFTNPTLFVIYALAEALDEPPSKLIEHVTKVNKK